MLCGGNPAVLRRAAHNFGSRRMTVDDWMMAVSVDENGTKRSIAISSSCRSLITTFAEKQSSTVARSASIPSGVSTSVCASRFYVSRQGAHPRMCSNAEAERFGIDHDRISTDRSSIFQPVNALGYAGVGHADLGREIAHRHASVLGQCGDYCSTSRVEGPGDVTASIDC